MTALRFSTLRLPPEARRAALHGVMASHSEVGVELLDDQPPAVTFDMCVLPDVQILAGTAGSCRCRISPGEDRFDLVIGQTGIGGIERESGHRVEVRPGTASIPSLDQPWTSVADNPTSFVCLALPRRLLDHRQLSLDMARRDHLPTTPVVSILRTYVMTILREEMELSRTQASCFATHIHDLVVLALGAERREEAERATRRGLRAARLAAIKADVQDNLAGSSVSLNWLAGRHNLSARAIRDLFYGEGTSFTDYLLGARLDRARHMLCSPAWDGQLITFIALEAGFGDLSWFYQAFRRRFGMTPLEMRHVAHQTNRS